MTRPAPGTVLVERDAEPIPRCERRDGRREITPSNGPHFAGRAFFATSSSFRLWQRAPFYSLPRHIRVPGTVRHVEDPLREVSDKREPVVASLCIVIGLLCPVQVVAADDDIRDLMTMDHHLVESDFIGIIRIESAEFVVGDDGIPVRRLISAVVEDVWATRWATEAGQELELGTSAASGGIFAEGGRYVVLLAGGSWNDSPLTHRGNSLFRINQDGSISCHEGTRLYAAQTAGFLCSIPELVVGDAVTMMELRSQVLLRLGRARARLEALDADLTERRRALESRPAATRSSEVRR